MKKHQVIKQFVHCDFFLQNENRFITYSKILTLRRVRWWVIFNLFTNAYFYFQFLNPSISSKKKKKNYRAWNRNVYKSLKQKMDEDQKILSERWSCKMGWPCLSSGSAGGALRELQQLTHRGCRLSVPRSPSPSAYGLAKALKWEREHQHKWERDHFSKYGFILKALPVLEKLGKWYHTF